MRADDELRHVLVGPWAGDRPPDPGTVDIIAKSRGEAPRVLQRCREVMAVALENSSTPWPTLIEWQSRLPAWFVDHCAPEMSSDQAKQWLTWWRTLPPDEQASAMRDRGWALADWLHWFEPAQREWFWWDALVQDADTLLVRIQVEGWPAPLGALEWLLDIAGATSVSTN